jgi:hypothetical protein
MLSEFETCRTLYELINRQILEEVRMAAPARGPAPAAPRKRSAATPPLLAGVMTLLLVLLTGGAILFRALPWLGQLRIETSPARWLSPFLSPTEARSVSRSIAESRLHAIDFAIQTYYLLNRGYPKNLNDLVTEGLLRLESLQLPAGQSIQYMSGPTGYQLKIIE